MMKTTKQDPGLNREVAAPISQLEALKRYTRVVADTADFSAIRDYKPEDATTNPSLILKAVGMPEYEALVEKALADTRHSALSGTARVEQITRELLVAFGLELLKIILGRVSVETRAAASFNSEALAAEGRELVGLFEKRGIGRERLLIKIASTWEGIQAARELQRQGIHCNMTLLFSVIQAAACAEAGTTLISPFVGRILDWHKKATGRDYAPSEDPGVISTTKIYRYCKAFGYPIEVMGASFRNKGEILELAGCDLLTISPDLLKELQASKEPFERKLSPNRTETLEKLPADEPSFRWILNEDAMATEKLAEGIRRFHADTVKLSRLITERV